jgi:hypothetical protein
MDNPKPLIAATVAGAVSSYFELGDYLPVPHHWHFMLYSLVGVAAYTATDTQNHRGEFLPFGQMYAVFAGMGGGLAVMYLVQR